MGVMHPCTYPGCIKKFDRKYNLKCHLRIHSNEKPYRCHHQNCTRSFRWKSSLNHHLMSLDHTPPALRRARKASAQRRRIHNNTSQSFLPRQHHPVFDLPTLSPLSTTPSYSHSPSPQPQPQSQSQPQPHNFKLEQTLATSDIPTSSFSSNPLTLAHQLHLVNASHVSQTSPDQSVPTIPQSQSYKLAQPHQQHSIITQLQDPLAMSVKPLQTPLIHDTSIKHHLTSYPDDSSTPTSTSVAETSLHIPPDDPTTTTTTLLTCSNKMPQPDPLVSITFEDFSPVSLIPFPSSLDSLFPANVDPSAMKTF